MERKLTEEQYKKLEPFKDHIMGAYKNSFVHVPGSEFNKIAELYEEIFKETLTKSQRGCNTCRLNALRKLGELYDKYGKEQKEKKSKGGRPKKIEG